MSLIEDESLLSFYYISQSSQKVPYQQGIEDHQSGMTKPKKQTGLDFGMEFISGNSNYSIQGEENP